MARRVRRRSLPASKRDRRRIVLNSLSLPPPVPLSRPEDGGRYRQETSSPQEAKISARRGPGTPVGLRPPSVPGPRPTPVIASLTLFVASQPNARLQQISALSGRHRHARRRRRGSRAFRNGAFPVKHVFSTPNAAHRFPARGPEGRSGKPVRWGLEPQRRGLVVVVGSGRTPVRRSPYRCPPPGSRFRPWSARRPPTSCLVQCGSRVPIR